MSSRPAETASGSATSGAVGVTPLTASKPPQKLSCTSCRSRKLKCDKQSPCGNCVRTGSECIYPARKRIQRPRKTKNAELLQRLHRLESIVGKVGLDLDKLDARAESTAATALSPTSARALSADPGTEVEKEAESGPKTSETGPPASQEGGNMTATFMGGHFWALLCDEVGGLKQALEQSTDSDSDEDLPIQELTPESGGGRTSASNSPGMLFSGMSSHRHHAEHPIPSQILYLTTIFFRNVDMHLKFLHRPTISNALHHLAEHPETAADLPPEREALFFAIYYAAITSLPTTECRERLNRERTDLATQFQESIERALGRADYLNSTSIEVIQALALYTCCLRSHNGSRASWSLLSLPIRLAQGHNLHQDGDGTRSRFTPYEAELRRRLWWQLIVLDCRAAEDRGTNTMIARGSYNTRLPHNINDDEFGPDTTTPLTDRPGPSDMTFSLCTAQCSGVFLYFEHATGDGPLQSEEDTVRQAQHLESQFVQGADPNHVGSYIASVLVRLIILKLWLVMRYPFHHRVGRPSEDPVVKSTANSSTETSQAPFASSSERQSRVGLLAATASRESTLRTAVSIMELSDFAQTGPYKDRFSWWSAMYVQWHPLAVALAELCTQTEGEIVVRAWKVIENVFPRWSATIADTKSGSLWRPIKKLYRKAKAARESALAAKGGDAGVGAVGGISVKRKGSATRAQQGSTQSTSRTKKSGLEPRINKLSISPPPTGTVTSSSALGTSTTQDTIMSNTDPSLGPRLLGDYYLSDPTANTLTSTTTTTPDPNSIDFNPNNINHTSNNCGAGGIPPTTSSATNIGGEGGGGYTAQNFETLDNAFMQSIFAWPDLNFAMSPPLPPSSSSSQNQNSMMQGLSGPFTSSLPPSQMMPGQFHHQQGQLYGSGDGGGGGGNGAELPMLNSMLDNSPVIDWSTWDEFVLDTYNADSRSKSGESEGSR
ncbi:hypothetical protein F5Y16DRAFT_382820 [Xylariaceae sp. FL0255]|nr:hypothetical protein F5Y16DRAFT_382820 [Xylariaceae sp. FL0255]